MSDTYSGTKILRDRVVSPKNERDGVSPKNERDGVSPKNELFQARKFMCITNRSLKKKFFPTCWMTFRVTESVTTPQNAINMNNCRWLAYVWAVQRQLRSGLSMNIYLNIHWFWTWLGMYMSVIVIESEKTANDCVTELPLFWRLVSTDFASNSTNVHMTRCSAGNCYHTPTGITHVADGTVNDGV